MLYVYRHLLYTEQQNENLSGLVVTKEMLEVLKNNGLF